MKVIFAFTRFVASVAPRVYGGGGGDKLVDDIDCTRTVVKSLAMFVNFNTRATKFATTFQ